MVLLAHPHIILVTKAMIQAMKHCPNTDHKTAL